jgi:hypothetical protein
MDTQKMKIKCRRCEILEEEDSWVRCVDATYYKYHQFVDIIIPCVRWDFLFYAIAPVLHFRKSVDIWYVPIPDTFIVLFGYSSMVYLFIFYFFCNGYTCGTSVVRAWYTN